MKVSTLAASVFAGAAMAQTRPANTSICDYYTTALLKNNTAANQATVLTLLVNTVVLGSKMPKPTIPGVTFPTVTGLNGILDPNATYMGQGANLLPYFDGGLDSTNQGGSSGVAMNFLDGGGAAPLLMAKPADNTSSNQYTLLTHLYQFFGSLLKCSQQGMSAFPAYEGQASMYEVHKFMALNSSQVGYFIEQVGLAAQSFGVSTDDVTAVGKALTSLFDVRCAPATTVIPANGAQLQSICITSDCPEAPMADCSKYQTVMNPGTANATLAMGEGTMNGSSTSSGSGSSSSGSSGSSPMPSPASGAGTIVGSAVAAGAFGVLAFFM